MAAYVTFHVIGAGRFDIAEEELDEFEPLAKELDASGQGMLEIGSGGLSVVISDDLSSLIGLLCINGAVQLARGEPVSFQRSTVPETITITVADGTASIDAAGRVLKAPVNELCDAFLGAADRYGDLLERAYPDAPEQAADFRNAIAAARDS